MSVLTKRTAEEAKLEQPPAKRQKKNNKNYYEIFGDDAQVEVEVRRDEFSKRRQTFLYPKDFHSLILWMLAETVSPSWIFIKHRPLINKVIIIQINNLNESIIKSLKSSDINFPFFNKNDYCPLQLDIPKFDKSKTKYPSLKKLTVVTIDKIKGLPQNNKKNKKKNKNKHKNNNNNHSNVIKSKSIFGNKYKHAPEVFLPSINELQRNGFPVENLDKFQTFNKLPDTQIRTNLNDNNNNYNEDDDISIDSSSSAGNTTGNRNILRLIGLDCEMVVTTSGIELARISVVSESGECIYDELVQPYNKIIDYCTKYSGITSTMMINVHKTLDDVYNDLSLFISQSTIICGHGLENDLLALRLIHYNVLDTTLLYPSSSTNFKNKLKYLSSKYLKRSIQSSHNGHNSSEDALAALDLVKLKFNNGLHYGLPKTNHFMSIFRLLNYYDKKSCLIGPSELFEPISSATPVSSIPTVSDNESINKSLPNIKGNINMDFIWLYLNNNNGSNNLYNNLMNIYNSLSINSVIILCTGNKDFSQLNQYNDLKAKAIREGDVKQAEAIAAKIRNENFNAKQYPFWVTTKKNVSN